MQFKKAIVIFLVVFIVSSAIISWLFFRPSTSILVRSSISNGVAAGSKTTRERFEFTKFWQIILRKLDWMSDGALEKPLQPSRPPIPPPPQSPQSPPAVSLSTFESEGIYSAIHSARTYTIYPAKPQDPILIFIHGGGWRIGSKDNKGFLPDLKELQKLGMNIYSIDYRLSPEAKWPAQIRDVKCMLSFLATSKAAIGNKQRIFLFGHSAGGHLALMAALTKKEDFDGDCEWRGRGYTIIGVIASSPAIDLTNMSPRGLQAVKELLGYDPLVDKKGALAASPISYPSQDDPKVLVLTGGLDTLTKATENGQRFVNAFKAIGKNMVWYNFPNEGHNSSITDPQGQIFEKVLEFLRSLL